MNFLYFVLFVTIICTVWCDHQSRRKVRQGPPPSGGGGGTGTTLTANYNYADSTKSADSDPLVTFWLKSTGRSTTYNNAITNINKIQYSSKYVYVSCSGIPSYSIGPWTGNPNTASDQGWTFQLPRVPVANTGNRTGVTLNNIGVWKNGVTIFNADDGQYISGWKRNAYYFESASFDSCGGHPQDSGVYHNHIMPVCVFNSTDSTKHSSLLGYAFDGFPIYGPFGYTVANDSTSSIKRIQSSYKLRTMGTRTTLANGTTLAGPSIATYPLGAFMDDYEYSSGYGDLDEFNGRFCVTPEYPSGTYAYFTTTDSSGKPAYPYTLGYYYYGYVVSANLVSGKVSPSETTTVYYQYSSSTLMKANIHAYLLIFALFSLKYFF